MMPTEYETNPIKLRTVPKTNTEKLALMIKGIPINNRNLFPLVKKLETNSKSSIIL